MNRRYAFASAPRCRATSKRTGAPCRAPAVRGWRVCRFHGAGGGAPCGAAHGNYRTGLHTKAALAERRTLREMLEEMRAFAQALSGEG